VKDYERLNALLNARDDHLGVLRDCDGDGDVDDTDKQLFEKRMALQGRIAGDPVYQHVKTFLKSNEIKSQEA